MFDHLSIGVADLERAAAFYDAVLAALGHVRLAENARSVCYGPPGFVGEAPLAIIAFGPEARPAGAGFHLALRAPSREAVDRFHAAALVAGGTDDGPPGIREHYDPGYYAAFVRDPDGHRLEAVLHEPARSDCDEAPGERYERIGAGYARTRREDPDHRARIHEALGDARTVVNVGAGTGSYEPLDRHIIAIEPSDVMATQRPSHRVPAIRATAGALPLRDDSVDAAMAVLTLHHWDAMQEQGVRELRRVARGPVVIVTYDPEVSGAMWLMADYLVEVAELDRRTFPPLARIAAWLGGEVRVETLPIRRDSPDRCLGAFWAHPEWVFDAAAREATSGFARQPAAVVERVVAELERDLADGTWERRHGHLRALEALDVGLRLVVGMP